MRKRLPASSTVYGNKSVRCQIVPYLSSYEDVGHKRQLIWKQRDALSCIPLGKAAKLLKQHEQTGLNNALSHMSLIRGVCEKFLHLHVTLIKLIFDHKIKTNLNHGTCLRARDLGSENAIKSDKDTKWCLMDRSMTWSSWISFLMNCVKLNELRKW